MFLQSWVLTLILSHLIEYLSIQSNQDRNNGVAQSVHSLINQHRINALCVMHQGLYVYTICHTRLMLLVSNEINTRYQRIINHGNAQNVHLKIKYDPPVAQYVMNLNQLRTSSQLSIRDHIICNISLLR